MNQSAQNITLPLHVLEDILHAGNVMSQIMDENKDYLRMEDAQRMKYVLKLQEDSKKWIESQIGKV